MCTAHASYQEWIPNQVLFLCYQYQGIKNIGPTLSFLYGKHKDSWGFLKDIFQNLSSRKIEKELCLASCIAKAERAEGIGDQWDLG